MIDESWQVNLSEHQSQIILNEKISSELPHFLGATTGERFFLLTDHHLDNLYLRQIKKQFEQAKIVLVTMTIPAGESSKSLGILKKIYQELVANSFTRKDCLIAFGGGVIGDIGGLVASTYMRGMKLIQIPTSVVAQTDSSLGGKTAVDFDSLKNLIGTFYPAEKILVDPTFLVSLPQRELSAGLAEIIKMLLVGSKISDNENLLSQVDSLNLPRELWEKLILAGLKIKSQFVETDFYDFKERRYLNFGHTIGHAVEACADGQLRHGEAVSIGLVAIMRGSVKHHLLSETLLQQLIQLLKVVHLPIEIPATISHQQILQKVSLDKKVQSGQVELVLISSIGHPYLQKIALADFADWLGW